MATALLRAINVMVRRGSRGFLVATEGARWSGSVKACLSAAKAQLPSMARLRHMSDDWGQGRSRLQGDNGGPSGELARCSRASPQQSDGCSRGKEEGKEQRSGSIVNCWLNNSKRQRRSGRRCGEAVEAAGMFPCAAADWCTDSSCIITRPWTPSLPQPASI